jgi:hypothetical protein
MKGEVRNTHTYQMVLKNYVPFACLVKGYRITIKDKTFFFDFVFNLFFFRLEGRICTKKVQ